MHTEYLMVLKLWKVFKAVGKRISAILSFLGESDLVYSHPQRAMLVWQRVYQDMQPLVSCLRDQLRLKSKLQINFSLDYCPDLGRVLSSPWQGDSFFLHKSFQNSCRSNQTYQGVIVQALCQSQMESYRAKWKSYVLLIFSWLQSSIF